MFRKVIVTRKGRGSVPVSGQGARSITRRKSGWSDGSGPPAGQEIDVRRPAPVRVTALVVGLLFLLFTVFGEVAAPGIIELAFAVLLLGCGLAAAHPRTWSGPAMARRSERPAVDPEEQVRWRVQVMERRKRRCLETLAEIERCAAEATSETPEARQLDASAERLRAAIAAYEAGIAREQAAGLALRVARWLERLPPLGEGIDRLDLGNSQYRLQRLEAVAREGQALDADLRLHPGSNEVAARRANSLLEAGLRELSRLRVDLLERNAFLVARPEPARSAPSLAAIEAALERGWDWLCRSEARRELRHWAISSPETPAAIPEPATIVLPRGRDLGMLPFSLVLLGFTAAHAGLAVGDIALAVPMFLVPMAAFYALFLVPGVMLFREAVRARRREELTICGSSVMLRWRWALWSGVETVVTEPEAPVHRDEVGRSGEHPIHRLCLHGVDGRKLYFAFGRTEEQHERIICQMGRQAAPALPPARGSGGGLPVRSMGISSPAPGGSDSPGKDLPLF